MGEIKLEISDNRKFQDVALLIDREEVLKAVLSMRRRVKKLEKRIPKPLTLVNYLRYAPDIRKTVDVLLRRFKYPPGFSRVIIAAVYNNKVTNNDAKHCYFRFNIERTLDKDLPPLETPRDSVLITIYPYLLERRKGIIRDELEELSRLTSEYMLKLPKNHLLLLDTQSNIREAREWFWARKRGISSKKLLDDYNKERTEDKERHDINFIDQAISSYREYLKPVFW